jgi:outer membrane protein
MRAYFFLVVFVFMTGLSAIAQRFAYVDTEFILRHIPEYLSAQKQLDATSQAWQKEVDTRNQEIEKLYKAYQADQVLLTEDMRKRRENEIVEKERDVKEFQRVKFGFEGETYKKQIELVRPIQERVAKAIQNIAESQQLDMIFDKNSEVMLLYASPRLDKSNDVITRLGYKLGSFVE